METGGPSEVMSSRRLVGPFLLELQAVLPPPWGSRCSFLPSGVLHQPRRAGGQGAFVPGRAFSFLGPRPTARSPHQGQPGPSCLLGAQPGLVRGGGPEPGPGTTSPRWLWPCHWAHPAAGLSQAATGWRTVRRVQPGPSSRAGPLLLGERHSAGGVGHAPEMYPRGHFACPGHFSFLEQHPLCPPSLASPAAPASRSPPGTGLSDTPAPQPQPGAGGM